MGPIAYLLLSDPARDNPEVGVPHLGQQGLMGDFVTHTLPTLSEPGPETG